MDRGNDGWLTAKAKKKPFKAIALNGSESIRLSRSLTLQVEHFQPVAPWDLDPLNTLPFAPHAGFRKWSPPKRSDGKKYLLARLQ
jgi:hypothetical protein